MKKVIIILIVCCYSINASEDIHSFWNQLNKFNEELYISNDVAKANLNKLISNSKGIQKSNIQREVYLSKLKYGITYDDSKLKKLFKSENFFKLNGHSDYLYLIFLKLHYLKENDDIKYANKFLRLLLRENHLSEDEPITDVFKFIINDTKYDFNEIDRACKFECRTAAFYYTKLRYLDSQNLFGELFNYSNDLLYEVKNNNLMSEDFFFVNVIFAYISKSALELKLNKLSVESKNAALSSIPGNSRIKRRVAAIVGS